MDSDWETEQVHFSIEVDILERLRDMAEREGRKAYELVREAIVDYIQRRENETLNVSHDVVPDEGIPAVGDTAHVLNFPSMWTEDEDEIGRVRAERVDLGTEIWALEYGAGFFDYYKWRAVNGGVFTCRSHARFPVPVWNEIERRVRREY